MNARKTPDWDETETPESNEKPSKSEIKRRFEARQVLAAEIAKLPTHQQKQISMPEVLASAVDEMSQVRSHGGIRRQVQLLGKIMGSLAESEVEVMKKELIQILGVKKAARLKI